MSLPCPASLRIARLAVLVSIVAASPAFAQQDPPPVRDVGSATVGFGYARLNWNGCCADGFMIDGSYDLFKTRRFALAVMGDLSRVRFGGDDRETDLLLLTGVRGHFERDRRINFIGHFTAGVVRWREDPDPIFPTLLPGASGTEPMVGGGAGVLYNAIEMLGVKIQWDFWAVRDGESWEGMRRFVVAGVVRFGRW
jgi:hypothetical protein